MKPGELIQFQRCVACGKRIILRPAWVYFLREGNVWIHKSCNKRRGNN